MQKNNNSGTVKVYKNGGTVMPQEDDIISWVGSDHGHVGVVVDVTFDDPNRHRNRIFIGTKF